MRPFSIIVAMDEVRGIGRQNALAWHLPADLKHFKEITTRLTDSSKRNAVIMGRRTWESLPVKFRPLPNRFNIILSTTGQRGDYPDDTAVSSSLDEALIALENRADIENIFVIGGAQVYAHAITHHSLKKLYITELGGRHACDAFFPLIPIYFHQSASSGQLNDGQYSYQFLEYSRK